MLEACQTRLQFIHGRLVPHNYSTVADPDLHEDVHSIQTCINLANDALEQAMGRSVISTLMAIRMVFRLGKVFPEDDPLSLPLLRLMLAADDARHI